jgi:hypothetical protein
MGRAAKEWHHCAYDGDPIYRAVAEHQPDPPVAVIISPRATAMLSTTAGTAPTQRDRHIQMIRDKGRMGWAKDGRLWQAIARGDRYVPLQDHHRSRAFVLRLCLPKRPKRGSHARCSTG